MPKKIYYLITFGTILFFLISGTKYVFNFAIFLKEMQPTEQTTRNISSVKYTSNTQSSDTSKLLNSVINLNNYFLGEQPLQISEDNKFKKSYHLIAYYPIYRKYYAMKTKVEIAIYENLPNLYRKTISMNDTEIRSYFNSNSPYIDKIWGITNSNDFITLVKNLRILKSSSIDSVSLYESSIYNDAKKNTVYFLISVVDDKSNELLLNVTSNYTDFSDNQKSPYITFVGIPEGSGIS